MKYFSERNKNWGSIYCHEKEIKNQSFSVCEMVETRSEFSVHLFSNASSDIYPENGLTRFTVALSQPIILNGSFSVALSEIYFPPLFNVENSKKSRDRIVLDNVVNFKEEVPKTSTNILEGFLNTILRVCSNSVEDYDETYFSEF